MTGNLFYHAVYTNVFSRSKQFFFDVIVIAERMVLYLKIRQSKMFLIDCVKSRKPRFDVKKLIMQNINSRFDVCKNFRL